MDLLQTDWSLKLFLFPTRDYGSGKVDIHKSSAIYTFSEISYNNYVKSLLAKTAHENFGNFFIRHLNFVEKLRER